MLDKSLKRRKFPIAIGNEFRAPETHHRTIIYRVMKTRARKHKPIENACRKADLRSRNRFQHLARAAAVPINMIVFPPMDGWGNDRPTRPGVADMTEEGCIQNGVNGRPIIGRTFRMAPKPGKIRRWGVLVHASKHGIRNEIRTSRLT